MRGAGPGNSKGDRGFGGGPGQPGGGGNNGGDGDGDGGDGDGDGGESTSEGRSRGLNNETDDNETGIGDTDAGGGGDTKGETKAETPSTPTDKRANALSSFANPEDTQTTGDPNAAAEESEESTVSKTLSKVGDFFSQQMADFKADPLGYMGDIAKTVAPFAAGTVNPGLGLAVGFGIDAASADTKAEAQASMAERAAKTGFSKLGQEALSKTGPLGAALGAISGSYFGGEVASQAQQNQAEANETSRNTGQAKTSNPSSGRRSKATNAFSDRGRSSDMAGVGGTQQPGFELSNFDPTAYASHYQGMQANNPNQGLLFTT